MDSDPLAQLLQEMQLYTTTYDAVLAATIQATYELIFWGGHWLSDMPKYAHSARCPCVCDVVLFQMILDTQWT